jgi:post-segregation antitoxin (ccd killing protein)
MLKEVGASGQISLGKKFAGKLFDMQMLDTGEVVLKPMRAVEDLSAVAAASQARHLRRPLALQSLPAERERWEQSNQVAIAAFNSRIDELGSPAMRLHAWRKAQSNQVV